MSRTGFEQILRSIYFADEKHDKSFNKVRSLITHFSDIFLDYASIDSTQSVDEHMIKFQGRSSMRQYVKKKPIKQEFKFCYHCASKTGYLNQFDLHLSKKESREENLGPNVVLSLTECLEGTYCTFSVDNFFNGTSLIIKLFDKGLFGVGTARMGMKEIQ